MMLSVRCFSRAASRSILRPSPTANLRLLSTPLSKPICRRLPLRTAQLQSFPPFSTSAVRREPAGQCEVANFQSGRPMLISGRKADQELSAKLEQEIVLEEDSRDSKQLPPSIEEFLGSSGFAVKDVPGTEEVVLSKTFGDERFAICRRLKENAETSLCSIKIKFSIAEMNYEQDQDQNDAENALDDEEMYDDDVSGQSGGAQSKGTVNRGRTTGGNVNVTAEDRAAPADRPELADTDDVAAEEQAQSPAYPTTLHVTISKAGKGAMQIVTTAQDGIIMIENVYYYPKTEVAEAETPENDFARSNLYAGPPYQNLDPELQNMLERYLDERAINERLASFVPDYVDYKEQREYVQWLQNMKGFVES